MTAPADETSNLPSPSQLLRQLQAQFAVMRDCVPLAIGIDRQILEQLPETNRKALRVALAMHTKSNRYLQQTQRVAVRVNLDGTPAQPVLDEHRARAAEVLRERHKKKAAEQKAAREAEQAERRLQDKLGQLAQKFGRGR